MKTNYYKTACSKIDVRRSKKVAIDFAEWIRINATQHHLFQTQWMYKGDNYTTEQLFKEYKNENK